MRMREKWNVFDGSNFTVGAIQPVRGEFKYNLAAAAHRFAMNTTERERRNRQI